MGTKVVMPSAQEIAAIIGLEGQPVLRNLKITQCYRGLSEAIAAQVGAENLNWCSFAIWASKTAGRFIRSDELLPIFRAAFADLRSVAERLERINRVVTLSDPAARVSLGTLLDALESPVKEISRQVAAGNLAVFAELGAMFSAMCDYFAQQTRNDATALAELLRVLRLKDGMPADGGQGYLKSSVQLYACAKFEAHTDRKAELILLANAQTGLHEQIRLQPAIAGSLRPPFSGMLRELYERHTSSLRRARVLATIETTLSPLSDEIEAELNLRWRETVTRLLMTLQLPDGEIHLGRDLQAEPGKALFPPALRVIEYRDLRRLLSYYHADGDGAVGSAATDWADIPERMRFILTLFRARQLNARLFTQPFSTEQRNAIASGRIPPGPL